MGKHYVRALRELGVGQIRVCSLSQGPMDELKGLEGVTVTAGGDAGLGVSASTGELGIVATPTGELVPAAKRLAALGFKKTLIEKPASLWSSQIEDLGEYLDKRGVDGACAYNRLAYPSFLEARARASREGGITSCVYSFTEIIRPDWPQLYPPETLARWGIANSLHVIGMAHEMIGLPEQWSGHRTGALSWHPSGSVFVGSGISDRGIPFSYQSDWGSKGRWSVEVNTRESSYRLCPLEKLYAKTSSMDDWQEIPVSTFAPQVKEGIAEQVAAMLCDGIGDIVPQMSLREAAALTAYGEQIFGYSAS